MARNGILRSWISVERMGRITVSVWGAASFSIPIILHISAITLIRNCGMPRRTVKYGDHWRVQVIAPSGAVRSRYSSMAVDAKANIIYIAYKDPVDGSLKVAVGNKVESSPSAVGEKKIIKNETVMDHRY